MAVESNRSRGLQKLPINRAKNPDVVIRASSRSDDTIVLIDHLHELADDEGHGLNPLDFLLGSKELPLEILLLILDVLFLDVDELELALEGFEAAIEIIFVGKGRRLLGEALDIRSSGGEGRRWLRQGFRFQYHRHCFGSSVFCLVLFLLSP